MRNSVLWTLRFAVIVALAVSVRGAFAAQMSLADEMKTAIAHAGFAEKYDSMNEVSLHLHHVVNCLVGANDPMFDKAAGNPCPQPDLKERSHGRPMDSEQVTPRTSRLVRPDT